MANHDNDISTILSALLYSGVQNDRDITGTPLGELFDDPHYQAIMLEEIGADKMEQLRRAIVNAGLEDAVIADSSRVDGDYGTMHAMTIRLSNGDMYVAYRGTGAGNWQYNADSAFGTSPSDMQQWALAYFDETVENHYRGDGQLYVTGHSQGGNNAVYVTLNSEHGALITSCVSVDGPGFSQTILDQIRERWGDEHYENQRMKCYGVYGENDYVHGLGETQVVPGDHVVFVATPDANSVEGYHDIYTHFSPDGLNPQAPEGPVSQLVTVLVDRMMADMSPEDRYYCAQIIMDLVEGTIGIGEDYQGRPSTQEILSLLAKVGPTVIETALHNPGDVAAVLWEMGLGDWVQEHPLELMGLTAAALYLCPWLPAVIGSTVALVYIIDGVIHLAQGALELLGNVKDFVVDCLEALRDTVSAIGQWLNDTFNPGRRYSNANPSLQADTARLRSYAQRVAAVNRRLRQLDRDMNDLYWQVGFLDLWDILMANLITGGSPNLKLVESYLNYAADRLEQAERKVSQNLGG